jgi:two-component system, NarL family, response regulator LiaR
MLAQGRANKEIAHELQISHHTVARHIRDIYERTGCHDRVALVYYLLREGIISVPPGEPHVENSRRS